MKNYLLSSFVALFLLCGLSSCQKEGLNTGAADSVKVKCPFDNGNIVQKWSNVDVQTDVYDTQGAKKSSTVSRPGGFLNIRSDSTFTLTVPGVVATGKWKSKDCQLILQIASLGQRAFEIVKLTNDSFEIKYKEGNNVITHRYKPSACNYEDLLTKKWMNTFTDLSTYNNTGTTLISTYRIHPAGYFQLNPDDAYNVFSDNVPLSGKWIINAQCQLVLDSGTTLQRNFNLVKLTNDSLIIQRKQGNLVYTQHYKLFSCPSATELAVTWDNAFTQNDYYSGNTLTSTWLEYPIGFFKININSTYNVVSNNVPLNGTWQLNNQTGCKITLDKGTYLERTFDVVKFSADSLVIYRKDEFNKALTQHYKKH
jgi:hypothetical protein